VGNFYNFKGTSPWGTPLTWLGTPFLNIPHPFSREYRSPAIFGTHSLCATTTAHISTRAPFPKATQENFWPVLGQETSLVHNLGTNKHSLGAKALLTNHGGIVTPRGVHSPLWPLSFLLFSNLARGGVNRPKCNKDRRGFTSYDGSAYTPTHNNHTREAATTVYRQEATLEESKRRRRTL